jgi:hypothetical protein
MANPRGAAGLGDAIYREMRAAEQRDNAERERTRRVSRTIAEMRERDRMTQLADLVVDRLQVRAISDVTSTDTMGARFSPEPVAYAWPTVEALRMAGPLVAASPTRAGGPASVTLPTPTPTLAATEQTAEKAEVGSGVPTMGVEVADWRTFGLAVDLALQADEARARVQAWLDAAVARAVDAALLADLVAAAGAGETDLAAAIGAVTGYPGPVVIVTPVGTADLAASGYPLVVDPAAPTTLVVNAAGVSVQTFGPFRLEALRPSHAGTDLSAYGDLVGPIIGSGAVATLA